MSKLVEPWENRFSSFNSLIPSSPSTNNFLLTTILSSPSTHCKLTSKTTISQPEQLHSSLTSSTDLTFTYSPSSNNSLSISHKNFQTTVAASLPLTSSPRHLLTLHPKLLLLNEQTSFPSSLTVRYLHSNATLFSIGIDDYDYMKHKIGGMLNVYGLHGAQIDNGLKLFGGMHLGYNLKEGKPNAVNCVFSFKKDAYKGIVEYSMKDGSKGGNDDTKKWTFIGKDFISNTEKVLSVKGDYKINKEMVFGMDSSYNINKNNCKNVLYTNYKVDPVTTVKAKWEDCDQSFTVALCQKLIDMIAVTVSGKVTPIKKDKAKLAAPLKWISPFQTKIGIAFEIKGGLL